MRSYIAEKKQKGRRNWAGKQAEQQAVYANRRRRNPSPKKVPLAVVEKVLGLCREKYFDLNVRHFHEKLQEEH